MEATMGFGGFGVGAIFLVVAAIGFLFGMLKGTFRSLSDIVFVLFNAVISALISKSIAKAVLSPQSIYDALVSANESLNNEGLSSIIASLEQYMQDGEFLANADFSYVLALPVVLVTPLIFMVVFFIIGLLLKIVKLIIQKLLIPKTRNIGLRLLGGALCAASSVLALAIFSAPLIGYTNYAVNTGEMLNNASQDEELVQAEVLESVQEVSSSGAFGMVSRCGGQWLFEALSSTRVHDIKVSLTNETEGLVNTYVEIAPLLGTEITSYTDEEIQMIKNAIDQVEKSQYLTGMVSSIFSQVATELKEENKIVSYELPDFGETLNPVVQTVLEFCSTMDSNGLVADLRTYTAVLESMVKHGLFVELNDENGDLYTVLENGNFFSDILTSLYVNERTRPLVPALADAMQSYLYEVYEEVNGFPYGNGEIVKVDVDKINATSMNEEGHRIATAIKEIRVFAQTIEGLEYVDEMVQEGDFAALGRGLNQMRDSIFFGNSYHFLLDSILHSETCANIGIFDSNFVENATKPNADMENLLLARQHLANLTIAMWDGDKSAQEESLKVLIEQVIEEDSEALKELATAENLEKYGVRGEKGETISAIATSIADTIYTHEYTDENGDGSVEDEKHAEAEKAAHIITVISGAHDNSTGAENVFDDGSGESKTGETAGQLVDSILDSDIATEMVGSAIAAEGTDPYGVQGSLTEADQASLEAALNERYSVAATDEEKQAVSNIASIFGISLN